MQNIPGKSQPLDKVAFVDCVAWSRCATFKVGFGVGQSQTNIVFKDSCSYQSMKALSIERRWGPPQALLQNVKFENMDIEGFWPRGGAGRWLHRGRWLVIDGAYKSPVPGPIRNIVLKNINVRADGNIPSTLVGGSPGARVENVVFDHITYLGRPAATLQDMNVTQTNPNIKNITIK
jgi:hypothetical protein